MWIILLAQISEWFRFDPEAPQIYTIHLVTFIVHIVALIVLLGFRVRRLVGAKRKSLFNRLVFEPKTGQQAPMPWHSVLFGISVFRSRYV